MSTTAQASMANSSTWARMRDKGCSVSRAKIPPGYAHESVSSMRAWHPVFNSAQQAPRRQPPPRPV
eukprot:CAMPEP_0177396688 /NCGR_PEP_ID=MMETSP0368-20130122/56879_1 /TAXON_ID=447022 ORGANISM="Scrippsiella hangoei-like, Strain SHHI-4" /NCGR_SAMPLE_ID=MMETSP0368 /ASSEMBLY_ACC=CAM_ASM_000363 /LENGTH=65 /DNA_ID=CAMNT_0018863477 /DNA_START=12 /DNA_END=206 /DNA_ORIENTATION=-